MAGQESTARAGSSAKSRCMRYRAVSTDISAGTGGSFRSTTPAASDRQFLGTVPTAASLLSFSLGLGSGGQHGR